MELRKIATEVYQELTSDSSDSDDDGEEEDFDKKDEERVAHATKFPLYTISLKQVVKEEDLDSVHATKFPLYTKSLKQVAKEDYFDSEDEIDRVSERRRLRLSTCYQV